MSRKIRMRLLFDDWPAEDRKRWESAFKTGDRFDESGPGAHLAEINPAGVAGEPCPVPGVHLDAPSRLDARDAERSDRPAHRG